MEEDKEICEESYCHTLRDSPHLESDFVANIMQQTENMTSTRDRKLTEKGQKYKMKMLERRFIPGVI